MFAGLEDDRPCEALAYAQQLDANSWFITHMVAAAAAGLCGDAEAATEARRRLLAVVPDFEAEAVGLVDLWKFNEPLREAMLEGLQAAGLNLHGKHATTHH